MKDLIYSQQKRNSSIELIEHFRLQRGQELNNNYLEGEARGVFLPIKNCGAGQRRLRTETGGGPMIKAVSNELLDALTKYGNNSYGLPAIHCAIMQGDEKAVRLFLDHGASPNSIAARVIHYEDPVTALGYAAKYGQLNIAKLLIDSGADIDSKIHNSPPAIIFALQSNHPEIIKLLVENGAKVNPIPQEAGQQVYDPISYAIELGSLESLQLLLELGGELDHLKSHNLLATAARSGTIEMVKFLLDQKVPIDVENNFGYSALNVAVEKQDIEMIKLLISHGAKIYKDCQYRSIWWTAINIDNPQIIEILIKASPPDLNDALREAAGGKINTVKALIDAGADVNIKDRYGERPLIYSVIHYPEILQLFINNGAVISPPFNGGMTPLHCAALYGIPESIHILMKAGAQINEKNADGRTPLSFGADEKTILALLERGADLNIPDNFEAKPLLNLIIDGRSLSSIKILVNRGASVNEMNKNGESPVRFALRKYELLEYLVNESGANINIKDSAGRTPFWYAVESGNFKAMEILVKKGTDINVKDIQGNTPLMMAKKRHQELVEWLVAHGAK